MKSPDELAAKLARQWENSDLREQRLTQREAWPVEISIGRPTASEIREDLDGVRQHIQMWKKISIGEVEWRSERYRDTAETVEIPRAWRVRSPSEWVAAAGAEGVSREYTAMKKLCAETNVRYHRLWIRQRSLWREKPLEDAILSAAIADKLTPGCANGAPLRTLSAAGNDTKFFERNRALLIALLDVSFKGEAGRMGLESFLGAMLEGEQWLLLADLDGSLLSFEQLRVRASELAERVSLPGKRILVVENERCLYLLPKLPDTLVILGAGLNLSWLSASAFVDKPMAYWGDLDTWGLVMLSLARSHQAHIEALMMTRAVFDQYVDRAVQEPVKARLPDTHMLTDQEVELFAFLQAHENARLEQEFLSAENVADVLHAWIELKS
ncbi:DUF3322 domain-containing protein [Cerasicoccus fimbriatus]|uniref:DUF3322 domain-containing protein n=1 Tax=Cerasicoccus fimbriatus TaxID=3014554 RepID=UPI0022B3E684|nr:DUF3322 domain-containing protein [Cerasicoccus sp. TK19100]